MSFHTPARTDDKKHRIFRSLDWQLVAAFAALALVLMLGWGFYRALAQNDDLIDQGRDSAQSNKVLVQQVESLRDRLAEVNAQSKHDRHVAARERNRLLHQQDIMIKILRNAHIIAQDGVPQGIVLVSPSHSAPQSPGGGQKAPSSGPTQPHGGPQGSGGHHHQSGDGGPQNGSDGPGQQGGGGGDQHGPVRDLVDGLLDAPCALASLPTC